MTIRKFLICISIFMAFAAIAEDPGKGASKNYTDLTIKEIFK